MNEIMENEMETEEDTQKNKYLIFTIDKEEYGIEIKYILEIISIQKITRVPELVDYIKGIINLRGKIIPVMDVRLRFRKMPMEYDDRTCIIVVDVDGLTVGLIVDRVSEVINIPEDQVVMPSITTKNARNKYINGIGKIGEDVRLLIECSKLLNNEDKETIKDLI
ncbi:MAG: chemotaxis protein CheW [Clostridiaceae bacterium]